MKSTLSPAAKFPWQRAATEAVTVGSGEITPAHMMIGLCSLQLAGADTTPEGPLDRRTAEWIEQEERIVRHALETAGAIQTA